MADEAQKTAEALEGMVWQFAYRGMCDGKRVLTTGGLVDLEFAFEMLGWSDPHFVHDSYTGCQWKGCENWCAAGIRTPDGYRRVCRHHLQEATRPERDKVDNLKNGFDVVSPQPKDDDDG